MDECKPLPSARSRMNKERCIGPGGTNMRSHV